MDPIAAPLVLLNQYTHTRTACYRAYLQHTLSTASTTSLSSKFPRLKFYPSTSVSPVLLPQSAKDDAFDPPPNVLTRTHGPHKCVHLPHTKPSPFLPSPSFKPSPSYIIVARYRRNQSRRSYLRKKSDSRYPRQSLKAAK